MPRNVDLSTLGNLGPGSIPEGAVEDVSLKNPQRDSLALSAHVNDPSRAHMADTIGIVDAGGFYSSDDVEGALQEIGGAATAGRQNGVVTGFGFVAVGLNVTFDSPSSALIPTLRDYSGESIALPDNTPSIWVYLSPSTGLITQFLGALPPSITSPENVLLWNFATLGGVITNTRDARLYVRNLDRKLPFTVRSSGPQTDQESEACFVSLDAAFTYLGYFSTTTASRRTEVIVRGLVYANPIGIPVDNLHIKGEDGAVITLSSGAYLFDVGGHPGVTISDITLENDSIGATAVIDTVGDSAGLTLQRVVIQDGATSWYGGASVTGTGRLNIESSRISCTDLGVVVDDPATVSISNSSVEAIGFTVGSVGIRVGATPTNINEEPSQVLSCKVLGFDTGIVVSGIGHRVSGCRVTPGTGGAYGIQIESSVNVTVSECFVDCSQASGLVGIYASGTAANKVTGLKIFSNTVLGAANYGIWTQGFVQESQIQGNLVDCVVVSDQANPTANAGICLESTGGGSDLPAYCTVHGNIVWRAKTGIYLLGASTQPVANIKVSNNSVHHCASGVNGAPAIFSDTSTGIGVLWGLRVSVTENDLYQIGSILTNGGATVQPTPANIYSRGIYLDECDQATATGNKILNLTTKGVGSSDGIQVNASGANALSVTGSVVSSNVVSDVPGTGIRFSIGESTAAFATQLIGAKISYNTVEGTAIGISAHSLGRSIIGELRVDGNTISDVGSTNGIDLRAMAAVGGVPDGILNGVDVFGNTVTSPTQNGIYVDCGVGATASNIRANDNVITMPGSDGIAFDATDGGLLPAGSFTNFEVSRNKIKMDPLVVGSSGIRISGVVPSYEGALISGNDILDAETGFSLLLVGSAGTEVTASSLSLTENVIRKFRGRGASYTVSGNFTQGDFSRNRFIGEVGSTEGIYLQATYAVASNDSTSGLQFTNNYFEAASGSKGVVIGIVKEKLQEVHFSGNDFSGGQYGVYVAIDQANAAGANPSIGSLTVKNNTFTQAEYQGVRVSGTNVSESLNLDISENVFDRVARDVGSPSSAAILFENEGTVRNITAKGNKLHGCGHSTGSAGGITMVLRDTFGLNVSGNFFSSTNASPANGNSIYIVGDSVGAPHQIRDVYVEENIAAGILLQGASLGAGIGLDLSDYASAYKISVSRNKVNRARSGASTGYAGILLLGSNTNFYDLRIEENEVSGASIALPITNTAISILGLSLESGSICRNSISGNPSASLYAQGTGIVSNFAEGITGLNLNSNLVLGQSGTVANGIYIFSDTGFAIVGSNVNQNYVSGYDNSIYVTGGRFLNFSVSKNESGSHLTTGITVESTGVGGSVSNLKVDGNSISTGTSTQTSGVSVVTTNTNAFEELSVSQNFLRYTGGTVAAGSGITIQAGSAANQDLTQVKVDQNQIVSFTNGIAIDSGEVDNVTVDNNNLVDIAMFGIQHTITGPAFGYSISDNQIQARTDSTAEGLIRIKLGTDATLFSNVRVSRNNVFGGWTSAGGTWGGDNGIYIGDAAKAPAIRSVSVDDNTVRFSKAGLHVFGVSVQTFSLSGNKVNQVSGDGIYFQSGGSYADYQDLTFSGNTVQSWSESAVVTVYSALKVEVSSTGGNITRSMNVSNNSVSSTNANACGYYLDVGSHNSQGLAVASNTCIYSGAPGNTTAMHLDFGAGTLKNYSFSNNVFRGSTRGIYQNGVFPVTDSSVIGNIGDNTPAVWPATPQSWSQFVNGGPAGWTLGVPSIATLPSLFTDLNLDDGT